MPRLFIVATPIGNLSDISARALQTLRDCDLIAAEDTRVTRALLNHFEINTPCVSNHQHNEENRAAPIVARMLEEDLDVALVTDAARPASAIPAVFWRRKPRRRASRCWPFRGRRRWPARFPSAGLTRGSLRFTAFCRARSGSFPKNCCKLHARACRLPSRTSRRTA